jgi:heat shock protein HslJ
MYRSRIRGWIPLGIIVAGVLMASCGGSESLEGTTWSADSVADTTIPDGVAAQLAFVDDASVSVVTGCNSFFGPYEVDGDAITIGPLGGTLMACPEPLMSFEAAYTSALQAATEYGIDGDELTLRGADGSDLGTFSRFDPQLEGSAWQVISYNNGNQAVVSLVSGTTITLAFGDDGVVSGSGGCNQYTGTFETDGDAVTIGALASTERACLDPAGVMDQELQYLAALPSATVWSVRGTTLELRDDAGALQVSAQPAS